MKLLSVIQNNHQVRSQLIVDETQSSFGEILGSFIQPAQKKEVIPHANITSLKSQASRKLNSLAKKLENSASESVLINKWEKKQQEYLQFFDAIEHCSHDYLTIRTVEGRALDTIQISPNAYEGIAATEQYYNIHLLGAKQMFGDRIIDLYSESARQNVNVIAFDSSNIGYSTGKKISCLNRLVADASAIVSSLLEQGVPANHITLYGFSLGGLVGTLLAAAYHKNNLTINIYVACTPMELTPCVLHWLTFIPQVLQGTVKFLLNYFKWDTDATKSWEAIPEEYKEFSFIDVENSETQASDNFIPVSATIYSRQKLNHSFDARTEVAKKTQIIESVAAHQNSSQKIANNLARYKHMLNATPSGCHHHFYLDQRDKKKKNPHGTNQYLLFNKITQSTPEYLFDAFESFIESRNQISLPFSS